MSLIFATTYVNDKKSTKYIYLHFLISPPHKPSHTPRVSFFWRGRRLG